MVRIRAGILASVVLACCACAAAFDRSLDISQYAHTAWKVRDGFAKGSEIHSIAQTPDGYLWLGTESGLYHFDGVRAVPWQPPAGQQLPSSFIHALLVARDGTLWIATFKGLASWKDGKLIKYPEIAGVSTTALLEDDEGTVWVGTIWPSGGKLCAFKAGNIRCYGAGIFGTGVTALYEDRKGNLWVSAVTGLWRWAPGTPEHYEFPRGVSTANSLIEDETGALLLAANTGLKQLAGGKIQDYRLPAVSVPFTPSHFLRSNDGSLWITTYQGLLHVHRGRVEMFSSIDGLSGDKSWAIFEDREGNIWVGTQDGLDRFRVFAIPTISRRQGLSGGAAVQAAPDGSIWIGNTDGVNRWANDELTVYRNRIGSGESRRMGERNAGISRRVTEITNSGLQGGIGALGLDGEIVWVATRDGIFHFEAGRFVRVPGIPGGVTLIAGDGHGNVWIASAYTALFYWTPTGAVRQIPWSRFQQQFPRTLAPDPERGGLWIGFLEGGIVYLENGQVRSSYSAENGLGDGRVNHLRFGSGGAVWAATESGLSRIREGHIETLTSKNGLPCDEVHWSIEDDDHDVWVYMPCGLARIESSEWHAWVDDPRHVIKTTLFDSSEGVRKVGIYGTIGPLVTKSPDGRIWFTPSDGVSVIDPRHLALNKLPPPVHIEQIIADGKTYDATNGLRLPPRARGLTIDYTALSLVAPEKVHFRYKLEGQDRDWREVVNERQVQYSNLPPRRYRFRVLAANNSGVWNETGDTLEFVIPPAWYQTNWFFALCAVALLALIYVFHRLHLRQLRKQEEKFREAVETMPALAFVARPDGYRTFVNRRWAEYTGMTPEQAQGYGWHEALHPDDRKGVLDKWRVALAADKPLDYEVRLRRADGSYRWFHVRVVSLRDKGEKVVKWCGLATDIEDRKRAEHLQEEIAHINRVSTMGELTASLAHEIKQPIAATVMSAQAQLRFLASEQPDLEEIRDTANDIVKAGKRASDVIDRLRSLYKKAPPQAGLVDVNEVIEEMAGMLRGEGNRHGVSIRMELGAGLPKVMADRVQLQQVLMNLMLNGIEAMKETGGVLTLKSQLDTDGRVVMSVSDTGVGLPEDGPGQIFEAFFTTKPQGSGMGLAISRSIVESHGGRLWATRNDRRGATFHFTLPAVVGVAQAPVTAT